MHIISAVKNKINPCPVVSFVNIWDDEPISPNITANMNGKVTMLPTAGFLPISPFAPL
jgi:hypothetical protein